TAELKARLDHLGLQLGLFNAEPGDWAGGERGLASLPGRDGDVKRSIDQALHRAVALHWAQIHVMAGLCPHPTAEDWQRYEARLRWAATQAQAVGKTLLIEPLNPRDMPHYLLTHQAQAHRMVESVGSAH